ncbi:MULTISPECIES: hypothetical protein [unclassified Corallococcus]|uniref:hypothetical protein n=1 Tax=unclassified Corallococcus TaxID=2685029 RepID=UPI001A8D1F3B|nr:MULTISPECIES: hypothetical protein [unclassified Corallococcus]MBN9680869.1 hypothetical protein [Corallococcus sp. NCSPR001]WAS87527.1 hypothetical protein O0N60_11250 [Corallococcus sp. NCRR]
MLLEKVFSLVAGDRISAQDRALIEHVRELSGTFGAYVLEAQDRDDLIVRLDQVVGDPQFYLAQMLLMQEVEAPGTLSRRVDGLALESGDVVPQSMVNAMGASSKPYLRDLYRRLPEIMRCFGLFLRQTPHVTETAAAVLQNEDWDPLAFLSAPDVSVPAAEALLAWMRLGVLQLASIALLSHQVVAEPWLKIAIAELLATSSKRSLALLAALSKAEVSVDLLPADERLSPAALDRQVEAVQAAYARFNMAAEQSGEPVFPSAS